MTKWDFWQPNMGASSFVYFDGRARHNFILMLAHINICKLFYSSEQLITHHKLLYATPFRRVCTLRRPTRANAKSIKNQGKTPTLI